jgi:hypothetical protein
VFDTEYGNPMIQPNGTLIYPPFQLAAPTSYDPSSIYYPEGLPIYPIQFAVQPGQPMNANMNGLAAYPNTVPMQGWQPMPWPNMSQVNYIRRVKISINFS